MSESSLRLRWDDNKRLTAGKIRTRSTQMPLFEGEIDDIKGAAWLTPPEILNPLNDEFHFDFDACPYPRPAGLDNLREEWGKVSWMNPPVGKGHSIAAWVNKAVAENDKGKTVVMLLPFERWFRKLVVRNPEFRFPGPIHFMMSNGGRAKNEGGGRIPDIIVILRPRP